MSITFNITDWNAWTPGLKSCEQWRDWANNSSHLPPECDTEGKPDIAVIPSMLRRRLSTQGKAALSLMLPLHNKYGPMPVIYSSRHGEVRRTLTMLKDIANEDLLSPTQFSLSVHNATPGLFSIQQTITDNIVAMAAGFNDVVPALLEAIGQFNEATNSALVVFCDEPVPDIYQHQAPSPPTPYAAAFVISAGGDFLLTNSARGSTNTSSLVQALQLVVFAATNNNILNLDCNGSNWIISRV